MEELKRQMSAKERQGKEELEAALAAELARAAEQGEETVQQVAERVKQQIMAGVEVMRAQAAAEQAAAAAAAALLAEEEAEEARRKHKAEKRKAKRQQKKQQRRQQQNDLEEVQQQQADEGAKAPQAEAAPSPPQHPRNGTASAATQPLPAIQSALGALQLQSTAQPAAAQRSRLLGHRPAPYRPPMVPVAPRQQPVPAVPPPAAPKPPGAANSAPAAAVQQQQPVAVPVGECSVW